MERTKMMRQEEIRKLESANQKQPPKKNTRDKNITNLKIIQDDPELFKEWNNFKNPQHH